MDTYFVRVLGEPETIAELRMFHNAIARAKAASVARRELMGIYHRRPKRGERLMAIVYDGQVFMPIEYPDSPESEA